MYKLNPQAAQSARTEVRQSSRSAEVARRRGITVKAFIGLLIVGLFNLTAVGTFSDVAFARGAQVHLQVYSLGGKPLAEYRAYGNSRTLSFQVLGYDGRPLANGVYLAVVTTRDTFGNLKREIQKIVVLRGRAQVELRQPSVTLSADAEVTPQFVFAMPAVLGLAALGGGTLLKGTLIVGGIVGVTYLGAYLLLPQLPIPTPRVQHVIVYDPVGEVRKQVLEEGAKAAVEYIIKKVKETPWWKKLFATKRVTVQVTDPLTGRTIYQTTVVRWGEQICGANFLPNPPHATLGVWYLDGYPVGAPCATVSWPID